MKACLLRSFLLSVAFVPAGPATPATPAADSLGRQDPRSSVTGFLEACRSQDYQKAAEYLDLRHVSSREGPALARQLEAVLNSSKEFNVLHLSRNPEGNPASSDPHRVRVAAFTQDGQQTAIELERVALQANGPQLWLFSEATVATIPYLHVSETPPAIARFLPPFLVTRQFLATSLWKWLALFLLALLMISLSRLLDWILAFFTRLIDRHVNGRLSWVEAVIQPLRVMVCLAVFRIGLGIVDPSVIARLYIGRALEVVLAWSIVWCIVRMVDLFLTRMEHKLDTPQQLASRTMLHLGRRTVNIVIVVFAILLILQSWGYNDSTLIAGLGVGGIAVALAAQQTIANVFGGVSLVGDHPIRIGEFGKFGDVIGNVEDIGMRSTRIRTLARTVVSVPNSNFAGLNLENYSVRDKILFNPTFQIKRTTSDEQVNQLLDSLDKLFASRKDLQPVSTPARVVGLASGSFSVELFCYVLTDDIDKFYKIQGELYLAINEILKTQTIELA
jgi:MscS family membrane protein